LLLVVGRRQWRLFRYITAVDGWGVDGHRCSTGGPKAQTVIELAQASCCLGRYLRVRSEIDTAAVTVYLEPNRHTRYRSVETCSGLALGTLEHGEYFASRQALLSRRFR